MPRRVVRRRAARKPARKGRKGRKAPMGGRIGGLVPRVQNAHIVESYFVADILPNTTYNANFTIQDCVRATAIAVNFQYYRAKWVKYEYQPLYNTFQEGAAVAPAKPNLYIFMNRNQETRNMSLARLLEAGCRPISLVGNKTIQYKPNWCSPGMLTTVSSPTGITGIASQGLHVEYGKVQSFVQNQATDSLQGVQTNSTTLPTSVANIANVVLYNGHAFYVEQEGSAPGLPVCRLNVTVSWEFMGASDYGPGTQVDQAAPISLHSLHQSPTLATLAA